MIRVFAILILIYYSLGTFFLPDNNFAYLTQIPVLYEEYKTVNGQTDFTEFLEENFFDFEKTFGLEDQDDDPFEKEAKQVPFHPLTVSTVIAIPIGDSEKNLFYPNEEKKIKTLYLIKEYSSELKSIFHPPKYSVL